MSYITAKAVFLIVLLILFVGAVMPAQAAEFTVDDDNGEVPGGLADYANITAALAIATDGDTILVYQGTYTGYHEVNAAVNLTGIGRPVVYGTEYESPTAPIGDVFALAADGCVLQGFDIRGGRWSASIDSAAVHIGSAHSDSIVRDNHIEGGRYGIIASSGARNNKITYNTINDTYTGVWFNYARNNNFSYNEVTNAEYWSLHNTYTSSTTSNYGTSNTFANNTFDNWIGNAEGSEVLIDDTGGNLIANNTFLNRTYLRIAGDGNTIRDNRILGPLEYHFAGLHLGEHDNIVLRNNVSGQKYGILLEQGVDSIEMSGNNVTGCTYGFGYAGDLDYAGHSLFRHSIDTTNTVNGFPVYWIVGETGTVYNYTTLSPAPGYLALVGCRDILVEGFYMEKNAQSVLIYYSEDVTLDSITTHGNGYHGILVGNSERITIKNSHIDSNGDTGTTSFNARWAGIWSTNMSSSLILDTALTANNPAGIFFQYDCTDNTISGCTVTNNGHPVDTDESYGIRNDGSGNSNLTVTGCTIGNTFAAVQGIGITNDGDDSLFYNNRFFNHTIANAENDGTGTRFNVTPVAGTNIIGGPWIAGNSWDNYAGEDTNADGLGDTMLPYTITEGSVAGYDYYPLTSTFAADVTPPSLSVITPVEGGTYSPMLMYLEVTSPDADAAFWWYSLDGAANVTFIPNTTLTSLTTGLHTLQVWLNDTSGNENSTVVNFTAAADTTPPSVTIISPEENATYTASHTIALTVTSPDGDIFTWRYSLDSVANVTFIPNSTLPNVANGDHILQVWAEDLVGNVGGAMANFSVNVTGVVPTPTQTPTQTPTPTPTSAPTIGENNDAPEILPAQEVKPAFDITITSPAAHKMTERTCTLRYTSPVPLARASYSLDGAAFVAVTPGEPVDIERLLLGTHSLRVRGVDYTGKTGAGEVVWEVIPLAIGEKETVGTDDFPDEAAFGFNGQAGNYTLRFDAKATEEVTVQINRHLAGTCGVDATPVAWLSRNGQVDTITGTAGGWNSYTISIPAELVVPEQENIVSFVHTRNPGRTGGLSSWNIRNPELASDLTAFAPSVQVFTPDQALSPDDEMMTWVKISGVPAGEKYTAMVYLVAPDGSLRSVSGGGDPAPLDEQYVRNNHYGRLPGAVVFESGDLSGTYHLIALLSPEGSDRLVSFSSVPVWFSTTPSVHLFTNRETFTDGMPIRVTCAVTRGEAVMNATLVVVLERPEGADWYLPGETVTSSSVNYAPLDSDFLGVLDGTIGSKYAQGAYRVRSVLFDEEGKVIADDSATFTVSQEESSLVVRFADDATESRLLITDALTLETTARQVTETPHADVRFSVPPGTYWLTGEVTTPEGGTQLIPADAKNRVVVQPGEERTVQPFTRPMPVFALPEVTV